MRVKKRTSGRAEVAQVAAVAAINFRPTIALVASSGHSAMEAKVFTERVAVRRVERTVHALVSAVVRLVGLLLRQLLLQHRRLTIPMRTGCRR